MGGGVTCCCGWMEEEVPHCLKITHTEVDVEKDYVKHVTAKIIPQKEEEAENIKETFKILTNTKLFILK